MKEKRYRLGLIGRPVSHSLSPALFRDFFEAEGCSGLYSYELIEEPDFEKSIARFLEDFAAINVTAPYKEEAYRIADSASYEAMRCGATNLLIKSREGIKAFNTDFLAVREILQSLPAGSSEKVLIIGGGGAARAAAAATLEEGLPLTMINRSLAGLSAYSAWLKEHNPKGRAEFGIVTEPPEDFEGIIISCLPVRPRLPESYYRRSTVIEACYHPAFLAELPCRRYISGLSWLRLQAEAAWKYIKAFTDSAV